VEVRALQLRGALRSLFTRRNTQPYYELECWGQPSPSIPYPSVYRASFDCFAVCNTPPSDDVIPFSQAQADAVKECVALRIRKPSLDPPSSSSSSLPFCFAPSHSHFIAIVCAALCCVWCEQRILCFSRL
jgi:hypothetical protein